MAEESGLQGDYPTVSHMHEKIQDYFGDDSEFGVEI